MNDQPSLWDAADWPRLRTYVAGDATPDDRAAVAQWIAERPERAAAVANLGEAWTVLGPLHRPSLQAFDKERSWAGVLARARQSEHRRTRVPPFAATGTRAWRRWGIAAAGVVAGALALVVGQKVMHRPATEWPSSPMSVYATANNQRATIALPDGSTVALSVGTRLEVPATYARGNRTVRLTGAAFFTVAHRDGAPFTVVAGPSTTRVLGTRFLVRHYDTDTTATIAVQDGKVMVQSVVLSAAQRIDVGPAGVSPVRSAGGAPFSFVRGVLTLEGVSLSRAIVELDRWYDVDIRMGDPTLAAQNMKGEFGMGSPSELAEILEWMLRVRVVRDGRVLTLYPRS